MEQNKKKITGWKRFILNEYSLTIIICLSIFAVSKALNVVRVSGMSMFPTYTPNELVRTTSDTSNIKLDDVVVFKVDPDKLKGTPAGDDGKSHKLIKRVVAVEGDTVQVKNGYLYRNDEKVIDKFDKMKDSGLASLPITVKKGEVFVLGDNRNNSYDSRKIGTIKIKDISNVVKGKLLAFFQKDNNH